jgi:hypothetical protein
MIAASWSVVLILAQAACGGHGPKSPGPGTCDVCGVETAMVTETIVRMQQSPNWRARDNAAHALRKFDWRCHPELVGALAYTLLHDGRREVREEAAQSLTKMAPCVAVAHEALARAARVDPDLLTRLWARKGLRALDGRCEGACQVCGPASPLPGGEEIVISAPSKVPGEVPSAVPDREPVLTPAPTPAPEAGGAPTAPAPETPAPPIDSRVEPPPTELSPLPPPTNAEPSAPSAASVDQVRDRERDQEPASATAQIHAPPRPRRLFGLRLPPILSRR